MPFFKYLKEPVSTSVDVDNVGLVKDVTITKLAGENVSIYSGSISVAASSSVTVVDTGLLQNKIKIISISLITDTVKKWEIYIYNQDGTLVNITTLTRNGGIVENYLWSYQFINDVKTISNNGLFEGTCINTTTNEVIVSLSIPIVAYGIKIVARNDTTGTVTGYGYSIIIQYIT